jgi:Glycosyltransferase family 87
MNWSKLGRRKELLAVVFLLAMTITNVVSALMLAPFLRQGYQDFTIFYSAGRMVRRGQSHILYNLSAQYRVQQEFAPKVDIRQAALPYNHPPFEALLFVPFTFLPYLSAYLLWSLLNAVMVAASLMLLRKHFVEIRDLSPVFLVLAATGFPPVIDGMIQGQDSLLLLLLFVVALTAMEKRHDSRAGAALAAGLFKFHLVLPLVFLFLLALRRWRLLLGFAPVAALLAGIAVVMTGWRGVVGYLQFTFHMERTGAGGSIVGRDMPNLRGIVSSLAGGHDGVSLMAITIACSVVVIGLAMWWMDSVYWSASGSVRFAFTLATVTTILVSYHTLTYDLSLLLPVVLLLFAAPGRESSHAMHIDTILLVLLYLAPLFEQSWPHLNQFCWPVIVLFWLFWKLGPGSPGGVGSELLTRANQNDYQHGKI